MLAIDLKTLFIILITGNLFIILFFLLYIRLYRSRIQKLNKYAVARFLQSLTWLTYALNYRNLDPLTMGISTVPLAFGVALEVYCLVTANQKFIQQKLIFLFSVAFAYSVIYVLFVNTPMYRVIVASSFLSFFYFYIWVNFSLNKSRTKMQRVSGWLGFITGALFLIRALNTIFLKVDLVIYSQLYFNVLAGLGLFIITFSWPLIFLFLNKEYDASIIFTKDKELLRTNRQLKRMNLAKDRFFSIISHDLRSPMSSIVSILDLAEDEIESRNYTNLSELNSMANQAAKESFDLLDNLLQWSLLQSGKNIASLQSINLENMIDHITKLLQINLDKKTISFHKKIMDGLSIIADKSMLEMTIRNLISNAIKFTPQNGSITLNAFQNKDKIKIEIQDTGIGISSENIKKLFKIESNYSSEGTNNEKGTGLELVLCKEFIERNHGRIEVKSEIGKGSIFSIILPAPAI